MPYGLTRFQSSKQSHFVTFSCRDRMPLLLDQRLRDLFVECLERIRLNYSFHVSGYVDSEPVKDSRGVTNKPDAARTSAALWPMWVM